MVFLKDNWWKITGLLILIYVIIGGLLFKVPQTSIHETIRNIYFHVGMWFGMIFILFIALIYSLRFLLYNNYIDDLKALAAVRIGLLFGTMGLITGMIWAKFTWGSFWVNDPKLNGALVGMLAYLAYMVLRNSIDEDQKRARLSAVYNVFAFVLFFVFIMIIPRLALQSIHPGLEANPALVPGDLAAEMRIVFYPAIAGWFIWAYWLFSVQVRNMVLHQKIEKLNQNL